MRQEGGTDVSRDMVRTGGCPPDRAGGQGPDRGVSAGQGKPTGSGQGMCPELNARTGWVSGGCPGGLSGRTGACPDPVRTPCPGVSRSCCRRLSWELACLEGFGCRVIGWVEV